MRVIESYVKITPGVLCVDGQVEEMSFSSLNDVYRREIGDYPKFFKMDAICKLGFIASEILLRGERSLSSPIEDMAIIMFNRSSSLCNDRNYQKTINGGEGVVPSPSLFVYTLPNIVTAEIAIRNKIFGETSFYVLDRFNASLMRDVVDTTFMDTVTKRVLCGWVDCMSEEDYLAVVYLVAEKADNVADSHKWEEEEIRGIFNR